MRHPVFWSFRRCPYAMRARLALSVSGVTVELREVVLRDKPLAFLDTSPTATVPCLDTGVEIIDESFDIMLWALKINDPEDWLDVPEAGFDLVAECDGRFKTALDRYKYSARHHDADPEQERAKASCFVSELERMLDGQAWLFGARASLADMAILPFIRQFAHVDPNWFGAQPWPNVLRWLNAFKSSDRFAAIMPKFPQWQPDSAEILFP